MDMFKWVGRKKREEGWMKEPRALPDFAKSLTPADAGRWAMSREFVNNEDKNLRVYLAVWQPSPDRPVWEVLEVSTDLKTGQCNTQHVDYEVRDPMRVVQSFCDFERRYKANAAYIPHEDHRPTYRTFANKFGIHFDEEGRVFHVAKEAPLATGTFMNRNSLDKLFSEPLKKVPLDTWEGLYEGLINKRAPAWTVTEQVFAVPTPVEGQKIEVSPAQYPAEAWTPPAQPVAPPPAPVEPAPLSAVEANQALDGLKAAFRKAAEADTGPARELFGRLRDQFTRALDETTRRSGKPSAEVFSEIGPMINDIFSGTMGDIMEASMKDNRAMETFQTLVGDVTGETKMLKNSVPRRWLKGLPDIEKNGMPKPLPPASAPDAAAAETAVPSASQPAAPATTEAAAPATTETAAPAPEAAAPAAPATVDGKTFEQLAKEAPYAGFQAMQKLTVTRPATGADLAADPSYAEYAEVTQQMIDQLKLLPQVLLSKTATPSEKATVASFQYAVQGSFQEGRQDLAQHEAAATALVGLLRTGVALYAEQLKKFTPEGTQMVSRIGDVCVQLAVNHLGVEEEEAKNISKIIARGKDPFGPELPLEKLFAQFPPQPAPVVRNVPRAPEAARQPAMKPGPRRNFGGIKG